MREKETITRTKNHFILENVIGLNLPSNWFPSSENGGIGGCPPLSFSSSFVRHTCDAVLLDRRHRGNSRHHSSLCILIYLSRLFKGDLVFVFLPFVSMSRIVSLPYFFSFFSSSSPLNVRSFARHLDQNQQIGPYHHYLTKLFS